MNVESKSKIFIFIYNVVIKCIVLNTFKSALCAILYSTYTEDLNRR